MNSRTKASITIDVPLTRANPDTLGNIVKTGLLANPRTLPSQLFYDERGSTLFEQISELARILPNTNRTPIACQVGQRNRRTERRRRTGGLGSGAATKTRVLLDAMARADQLRYFVPFDVDETIVRRVSEELVQEYPRPSDSWCSWRFFSPSRAYSRRRETVGGHSGWDDRQSSNQCR